MTFPYVNPSIYMSFHRSFLLFFWEQNQLQHAQMFSFVNLSICLTFLHILLLLSQELGASHTKDKKEKRKKQDLGGRSLKVRRLRTYGHTLL